MESNNKSSVEFDSFMAGKPTYNGPTVPESEITVPSESDQNVSDEEETQKETWYCRPRPYDTKTYQLEKFEKNALLIFNHNQINGYNARPGTEHDVRKLKTTFKRFGFEVKVEDDLTKDELMDALKIFTSRDFTDYGCVGVVILSHGIGNGQIRAKDLAYYEADIVALLQARHNSTLNTKPRLLIVQACRGTKSLEGVPVGSQHTLQEGLDMVVDPYSLPVEADMLVFHCSYPGKRGIRDPNEGSWFIQELCDKINELAPKEDINTIFTKVKRSIAVDKMYEEESRITSKITTYKQMPVVTSTLTRKLYFSLPQHSGADAAPRSTSPSHHTHCQCFLRHFAYIRETLGHYVENNPDDATAKIYLDLAKTFHEDVEFNKSKLIISEVICDYLYNKREDNPYLKYLYYYRYVPKSND